jgi:hypothetical protein
MTATRASKRASARASLREQSNPAARVDAEAISVSGDRSGRALNLAQNAR